MSEMNLHQRYERALRLIALSRELAIAGGSKKERKEIRRLERSRSLRKVLSCLDHLPDEQREVFVKMIEDGIPDELRLLLEGGA